MRSRGILRRLRAAIRQDREREPGPLVVRLPHPEHGMCAIQLPGLKGATPEQVDDLRARVQRAVDEWSSARAGKFVYEHTGRKYDVG